MQAIKYIAEVSADFSCGVFVYDIAARTRGRSWKTERTMIWDTWGERWNLALEACSRQGGMTRPLAVGAPAAEQEIMAVEQDLRIMLPTSFRTVLKEVAASVDFFWSLPETFPLPFALREISSGECYWNLTELVEQEEIRQDWVRRAFPDPEDEYCKVWHNKLAFAHVMNGDMLAFDLAVPSHPVVYLSHDGGDGHGYRLGADFADFVNRSSLLGCVGYEDWQMMPFLPSPASLLDPDCENAYLWRSLFGINFTT